MKASAGRVYTIRGYNRASAPTVGTDAPVLTLAIKPSDGSDIEFGAIGEDFSTAIAAGDILGLNVIYA